MITVQLFLYCLIFTLMVRFSVRGGAIEGLYFYPKPVQDRAIEMGLTTRETMNIKRKIFMTEFYVVMLVTLVLIIGLWNHVSDFKTAYLYALLFLEIMNWYDGIFIDEVWVRYSKFWVLPGCEDIPYLPHHPHSQRGYVRFFNSCRLRIFSEGGTEMKSRNRILLGCYAMVLAIIGDYLLGYGTISTSSDPDAYMGIAWNVAPDWRYAVSSILGFICAAMFAYAAVELLRVMEERYKLTDSKLYKIFKVANWSGILFFAFIHIGICMLPVVFNAGMEVTNDVQASAGMTIRVLKSIAVPLGLGFVACDLLVTIGWIGMVIKGMLPVKKVFLICCPVCGMLLGQLLNLISEGLDSGTESFGWLVMYLVCAIYLAKDKERTTVS